MAVQSPLKTFAITQQTLDIVGYIDDVMDPTYTWVGFPYKYRLQIEVTPVMHGDPSTFMQYSASDVSVGQWIATSTGGIAVRIDTIEEVVDYTTLIVTASDVDMYNIYNDPESSGTAIGPDGAGLLFSIDENGLPLVGPAVAFQLAPIFQPDLQTRFFYTGDFEFGGGSEFLNNPTSGDVRGGAVVYWTEDETTFTDAIDELNRFVLKISPERPLRFQNYQITIENGSPLINDYNDLAFSAMALSEGTVINNSGIAIPAGTIIHPVRDVLAVVTNPSPNLIVGDKGIVDFSINGTLDYSLTLDATNQSGNYNGLSILSDGIVNDVWPSLSIQLSANVPAGASRLTTSNTYTGTSEVLIIDEAFDIIPDMVVSGSNLAPTGDIVYTSGIPHFTDFTNVTFQAEISNVSLNTYPTTKIVEIKSSIFDNSVNHYSVKAGQHGTPSVFAQNQAALPIDVIFFKGLITNDYGYTGAVDATVNNAFNQKSVKLFDINYYGDFDGTSVIEITPDGYEDISPKRHPLANEARPVISGPLDYATNFTDSDMEDDSAIVVGGKLKFSKEDFGGYIPSGPDFSGRTGDEQFACFKLQAVTNSLSLMIDGTFKNAYIKLPGITLQTPNTTNGWFDLAKLADFAPGSWPGTSIYNDGCLINKSGNRYDLSFGSISSAFSDDNLILIQFVLEEGDIINSIYRVVSE